jgi:hypothetical protein
MDRQILGKLVSPKQATYVVCRKVLISAMSFVLCGFNYFWFKESLTMKKCITAVSVVLALGWGVGNAVASYIQGFEGSGYDFYADTGSSADVTTAASHTGSQAAEFTLDAAHFAYTRWKSEDLSSYGFKVKDVIASDWAERTLGRSDLAPYLLFTVATPDTGQETLAIQFSMPTMSDNTWTQNIINRDVTTFHVTGDRTGLGTTEFSASGTQGTLNDLASRTYSGTTKWGDFAVTRVRIGVGLWDASQTWHGYADDLAVSSVPEPCAIAMLITAGLGMLVYAWRRRRS